ncbi:IclR family transcriptional regulator [Raineyella sp. LH-20]|uniref:IclR family transcriptional regulator n=1 Tax=Raineyella sp. LH-20 TaxID=3081204 RepID=UPI002953CBBC|nr:IclR family transcriptional regulator [Raineyella sp. LH-20]WOP19387.1 IclR family transcriptional regulator [Raineyella sp. LH-20]
MTTANTDRAGATPGGASRSGVLERSFAILNAFRPSDECVQPSELARRAGLSKATGHRIVQEMVILGILEKGDHGVRIGLRMFEIGQLVALHSPLRVAALPFLSDLAATTGGAVHLSVLEGADVVYLEIVNPIKGLSSRTGGRLPAQATAAGWAILAFSPDTVIETIATQVPARRPSPGRMPTAAEIAKVRSQRYAQDPEADREAVEAVAVPVLDPEGYAVAALSLLHPSGTRDLSRFVPALQVAAKGLSRALHHLAMRRLESS